jgi:predicted TIM-barrel fold metal-dependent hydrolase
VSEPVGHRYPGKGTVTPEQPCGFAHAFPTALLVCAHWGGGLPFYALMPEVGSALSNTYYDTAATQYLYRPDVFQVVAGIVGEQHLLFGSDFPLIGQRRALDHVRSAGLPPQIEAALLGGNAARLLGMETTRG